MDAVADQVIPWVQPRQERLIRCPASERLYGGARGGGKSWGVMFDWLAHEGIHGKNAKGILFRKTYKDMEDFITESQNVFPLFGGVWTAGNNTWTFESGAILRFRYLENDKDASNYIGHQYNWVCFEEAGTWASPSPLDQIKSSLRSPHGVPIRAIYTTNPGGVGHNWLKARFVTPSIPDRVFVAKVNGIEVTRAFIPSRFEDNPALQSGDPDYMDRIVSSGIPEWQIKAWRDGDWNITAGGMFDDLWNAATEDQLFIEPFTIPRSWRLYRSFDWGQSAPFSYGLWAVSDGTDCIRNGKRFKMPPGSRVRVSEYYGAEKNNDGTTRPNKGLRMSDAEVAAKIQSTEALLGYKGRVYPGPADPSIFNDDARMDSPSLVYQRYGVPFIRADNRPGSRVKGWTKIRDLMTATIKRDPDRPHIYIFNTCLEFRRTVPGLVRDKKKPDDVDTNTEDHIGDEARYFCAWKASGGVTVSRIGG